MTVLEVWWVDIFTELEVDNYEKLVHNYPVNMTYKSIGYLVEETEDYLVLASDYHQSDNEYRDFSIIPKPVILRTQIIVEPSNPTAEE